MYNTVNVMFANKTKPQQERKKGQLVHVISSSSLWIQISTSANVNWTAAGGRLASVFIYIFCGKDCHSCICLYIPPPPHHAAPELVSRVQLHTVVAQIDRYMYYDQVSSSVCLNADLCFFLCRPVVSRSSTQLGYSLPSPDTQLGYSVLPSGRERFFIGPAFGGDLDDVLLEQDPSKENKYFGNIQYSLMQGKMQSKMQS